MLIRLVRDNYLCLNKCVFFSVTKIVIFRHIANNIVRLLVKTTLNNKRITKTIKRQQKQHRLFTLLYEELLSLLSFVLFYDVECC